MVIWLGNPRAFQTKIPTKSTALAASSAAALNHKPSSMPATNTTSMLVNTNISSDTRENQSACCGRESAKPKAIPGKVRNGFPSRIAKKQRIGAFAFP